ncbi:hypothetical protein L6R50_23750 [Myxococcota bacterium]|nr:hypothetical protein [Myxococcota bacterium]
MPRAEQLAARLYRRALHRNVPHEGFLEDALAAALEHPLVWPRVREAAAWSDLPGATPSVDVQDVLPDGRTDIVLRWRGESLVLELKRSAPPDVEQLGKYLNEPGAPPAAHGLEKRRQDRRWVTAIAAYPTTFPEPFLPMTTWSRLRRIAWPDAPLEWRQFCHLIDAVGVAVSRLELPAVMGILPAWDARDVLTTWSWDAVRAVRDLLEAAGLPCGIKEGRGAKPEDYAQRFGLWTWPTPWVEADRFGVFVGVSRGTDRRPLLVPGVPDLSLMLHVNPECATAAALRADEAFGGASEVWCARGGPVVRQRDLGWWHVLQARESLVSIVAASDQGAAFRAWMTARAQEWIDAGIVSRVAAIRR